MHVVYEYCSKEPFFPTPTFMTQPKLKKQFYNGITNLYENWFHSESKLGSDFAIYKGVDKCGPRRRGWGACAVGIAAAVALAAITALYEVRTKEFNDLEVQLGSRPDDNPDRALQM